MIFSKNSLCYITTFVVIILIINNEIGQVQVQGSARSFGRSRVSSRWFGGSRSSGSRSSGGSRPSGSSYSSGGSHSSGSSYSRPSPPAYSPPVYKPSPPVYSPPAYKPSPPVYSPPAYKPSPPVYSPPAYKPSPPVYSPPATHNDHPVNRPAPSAPAIPKAPPSAPLNPKDSSGMLINHESRGTSHPSTNPIGHPNSETIHKVNVPTSHNAPSGTPTNYPPWANPSLNPSGPPTPPVIPNLPKPPAPYPPASNPIKPPTSTGPQPQPIIPKVVSPNSSKPPAPYPTGHPVDMPRPNTPIGFKPNSNPIAPPHQAPTLGSTPSHPSYTNNYHPPPVYGSPPGSYGGYAPPPPYSGPSYHPVAGQPPNYHPAVPGQPTYLHPPVYGGVSSQPFVPGQSVIVLPGKSSSPGLGQMIKEALVYSTINAGVNAGVNRLVYGAPPHYHHYGADTHYTGSQPSVTNNTTIIYNNGVPVTGPMAGNPNPGTYVPNYSTNQPNYGSSIPNYSTNQPNYGSSIPPTPNDPGNSYLNTPNPGTSTNNNNNIPVNFQPKFGGSGNSSNYGNTTYVQNNSTVPTSVPNNLYPNLGNFSENSNITQNISNATPPPVIPEIEYWISDNELLNLTEHLFMKDKMNKLPKTYMLNFQKKVSNYSNVIDETNQPLMYANKETYAYKTVQLLRELYDNYQINSTNKENTTKTTRKMESTFINAVSDTEVMKSTIKWLQEKYYVDPDDFEVKDTLRHIWLSRIDKSTSGFERIFMAEMYEGPTIIGGQNWIYYDYQEYQKNFNYFSFVDKIDLSANAAIVKINMELFGIVKPNATMLVGTSPELEMALYTICFYARPNDICPVSLGGIVFHLYTHNFHYFGKDLIDLGFVIF